MSAKHVAMGEVIGVHGVRGAVTIRSHTRPPDNLLAYSGWTLSSADGTSRQVTAVQGGWVGKRLVVQLEVDGRAMDDRDEAAGLIGATIQVPRSAMPDDDTGYYWADLVGLAVQTTDDVPLGTVHSLMETGAHDVLVVRGERERLIPFVQPEIVKAVDLDNGLMTVDWDAAFE